VVATALTYPPVIGEWDTMRAVCAGSSIARFGDGELKLMHCKSYVREPASRKLAAELRAVLTNPHPRCIVGIPTMSSDGPKFENWIRHRDRFAGVLAPHVTYYSAFITRPDSAPWIQCEEFARLVESLWRCKRAAVICEPKNKILTAVRLSAARTKHIRCPSHLAYSRIDLFEDAVLEAEPEIALLSVGPTASCLANRLAAHGLHAVDIGSAGGYLLELLTAKKEAR
jgi:hypothetical protein